MNRQEDIENVARRLAKDMTLEQMREAMEQRQTLGGFSSEKTEQEREYWQAVFSQNQTRSTSTAIVRQRLQEMDYNDARRKVWALMEERAAQISHLQNAPFSWAFNEDEKEINRNLVRYFINDPGCAWPLAKGLFVFGAPGTGKSEMLMIMQRFCKDNELSKAFELTNISEVHTRAKADKDYDPITANVQFDRCFDEFGRHVGPVIRFGEPMDINEALIELRYERSRRYGQLTHFIANATPNEIETKFSPMIFDRVRSICTGVHFKGKSKR